MSENKKWDCSCQEYLKNQLNSLKSCQVNAKQKIEELLALKECPYKKLDKKSRENYSNFKSYWCSSTTIDPMENLSHTPNQNFMVNAGIYTRCECGEDVRRNLQWIDKSGEYLAEDDGWEEHVKDCPSNQIKSNQIKSNQIKSNQIKSNELSGSSSDLGSNSSKSNYLPWILGGIGTICLVVIITYFILKKEEKNNG